MMTEPLITAKELAAMLGVSVSWVHEHSRANQPKRPTLPSIRLGKAVRFQPESIRQFIADLEKGAAA